MRKVKNLTAVAIVVFTLASWPNTAQAAETMSPPYMVKAILATGNRPSASAYNGITFFELANMSWLPAACGTNYVALAETNKGALATLMLAQATRRPVKIWVEDTLKTGYYCHAVIVYIE